MYVNHKVHMNLMDAEAIPTLEMVQHDQLSRQVELSLLKPVWEIMKTLSVSGT